MIGLDYELPALKKHETIYHKIRRDISSLHFADDSFDLVTSNTVCEHLKEPKTQLAEVSRILKPGGILLFHTPNVFGYDAITARACPEEVESSTQIL